jgi:hypothetical protein
MTKIEAQSQYFDQKATIAKLLFLFVLTILLSSFGPMSIIAPVPLTIAFLLYGRLITVSLSAISIGLLWAAGMTIKGFPLVFAGTYAMSFLYAFLLAEVIFRGINPVKGLTNAGLVLVIISGSLLFAFNKLGPISLKGEISQSVSTVMSELKKQRVASSDISGDEQRAFDEFVSKPEVLTNDIFNFLPAIVFCFSFIGLWISFYVTLRNSVIWKYKVHYQYSLKDLTYFKVPEFFVYPLILSLVLLVGAGNGLPKISEVIGSNLLYCLGVFYLFQGFGVYNDFLKYLKIRGFLKTLFIAFTLILAFKFLAILGLFDLWINFRKFFTNTKKNEGDTI